MITQTDLKFVLEALYTFDAELEQLEKTEDWFSSDSRDMLESAIGLLHDMLGIPTTDYDEEDDETYEEASELHF